MTQEAKFTPGPWRIEGQHILGNEQNGYICTWSGRSANAHLIAAGPDLLEACKNFLKEWDNPESNGNPDLFVSNLYHKNIIHNIRQAITKAGGDK